MNKAIFLATLLLTATGLGAQNVRPIELNKTYTGIQLYKANDLEYLLKLQKGGIYGISVLQQGIDVKLVLFDENNKQILDKDSPNGQNGYEKFEYAPTETKTFHLKIMRLEEDGNPDTGQVTVFIKQFSKAELQLREKIKKELEPENGKTVQTLDIDHFWEAFDKLKDAKTREDSINIFQRVYLDRGTDGLKDFIEARQFTAEKFVDVVAGLPKFYNSVRANTWQVKNSVSLVEEIVTKFKNIYPHFKPFKVCFAIGLCNTGGTVSDKFLLIGTEVSTCTSTVDLSEFNNSAFSRQIARGDDVAQKIKNIVAHEYVHTQQITPYDSNAIRCVLLYSAMQEGFCDFIGELTAGSQINLVGQEYGKAHEKEIWQTFKSELCNSNAKNWLYNYTSVKDKPADLGYYVGYKIAEAYYNNATDKQQAVIDIIEMSDPVTFLQRSKYDLKDKK